MKAIGTMGHTSRICHNLYNADVNQALKLIAATKVKKEAEAINRNFRTGFGADRKVAQKDP